jgi:hypothetical protein
VGDAECVGIVGNVMSATSAMIADLAWKARKRRKAKPLQMAWKSRHKRLG